MAKKVETRGKKQKITKGLAKTLASTGEHVRQIGNRSVIANFVLTTCGTQNPIWKSAKPTPLRGYFVNFGICSIEVEISGVGPPQKVMIPSRAGLPGQLLAHGAANLASVNCLGTVDGGECVVLYILEW